MFLPLELTLRPSRVYAAVLGLAHGFALLGVWTATVPGWIRLASGFAVVVSAILAWREISGGPSGLRISQSGQVEIFDKEWRSAQVSGRPVVLPWLVSLRLSMEGGGFRRLVLWRDSAEAGLQRKLRVWLRWGLQRSR